jgi:hypothetical protein
VCHLKAESSNAKAPNAAKLSRYREYEGDFAGDDPYGAACRWSIRRRTRATTSAKSQRRRVDSTSQCGNGLSRRRGDS